jgi:2-hydroxychromene-2-carboxylate isomerase
MNTDRVVITYTDYKSPYAYLAKDQIYALERDLGVRVEWRPYVLNIPLYLGSATLDESGKVIAESRNPHQWRRVRYSYMDARRQAGKRGLTILGPKKIFDSSLAAAGMLFAQNAGEAIFRRYNDLVFERFFKRTLDIESVEAVAAVLAEAGAPDPGAFAAQCADLLAKVGAISREAEAEGVFGVPSFLIDGELFWGSEHLGDIREMLA